MRKLFFSLGLLFLCSYSYSAFAPSSYFYYDATGSTVTNSGCFISTATGTNYAIYSTWHASGTTLNINASTNTYVTDAAGYVFGSNFVGNTIRFSSGTTSTFRQIVAVEDGALILDSGAGLVGTTQTNWYIGGAWNTFVNTLMNLAPAGSIHYVKTGTYTTPANVSLTANGTSTTMIKILGYETSPGDTPTTVTMPTINQGAYTFTLGTYYDFENINITGSTTGVLKLSNGNCKVRNCIINMLSSTGGRNNISISGAGAGSNLIDNNYFLSSSVGGVGIATASGGSGNKATNNYFLGVSTCFYTQDSTSHFEGNICDSCSVAVAISAGNNTAYIGNNTITNDVGSTLGTTAINLRDSRNVLIENNIIDNFVTGIVFSESVPSNTIRKNNFSRCTTTATANCNLETDNTFETVTFTNENGLDFTNSVSVSSYTIIGTNTTVYKQRGAVIKQGTTVNQIINRPMSSISIN